MALPVITCVIDGDIKVFKSISDIKGMNCSRTGKTSHLVDFSTCLYVKLTLLALNVPSVLTIYDTPIHAKLRQSK